MDHLDPRENRVGLDWTDCRDPRVMAAFLVAMDSLVRREIEETPDTPDSLGPEVFRVLVARRVNRDLAASPENQEQRATQDCLVSTGPQDPLVNLASPAPACQDRPVCPASRD